MTRTAACDLSSILRIICIVCVVACSSSSDVAPHTTRPEPSTIHASLGHTSPRGRQNLPPSGLAVEQRSSGESEGLSGFSNSRLKFSPLTNAFEEFSNFTECDTSSSGDCTCYAEYGFMNYSDSTEGEQCTFEVDGVGTVMVWVDKSEISDLDSATCFFEVGDTMFDNKNNLRNVTTVYIQQNDSITFSPNSGRGCFARVWYAAVAPNETTIHMLPDDTEGYFSFPSPGDQTIYPWGYPFQQRREYFFDYSSVSKNYVIELEITHLDLGSSSSNLHAYPNYDNFATNDFLLIGLGTEILEDNTTLVLYGQSQSTVKIRLDSATAYVVFYGAYHEQDATGFSLVYSARNDTYYAPPSITTPTPPTSSESPPSTWATIDGVRQANSTLAYITSSFRVAVAAMATEYISQTCLHAYPNASVSPDDVVVHAVATCSAVMCGDACVAYNFSISLMCGDEWAFSVDILEAMIRDTDLQESWSDMCDGCEFCEETVDVPWLGLGGVVLVLLVMTLVLIIVAWMVAGKNDDSEARDEYATVAAYESQNARRRSSADVSIIGVFRSSSRRRSFPYRKDKGDQAPKFSPEHYDVADFTLYDNGVVEYGPEPGVTYRNIAYMDTEPEAAPHDFWDTGNRRKSLEDVIQRGAALGEPEQDTPRGGDEGDLSRWQPRGRVLRVDVHGDYGEETEL